MHFNLLLKLKIFEILKLNILIKSKLILILCWIMAKAGGDASLNGLKRLNSDDLDFEETDEEKNLNAILRKFKSSNGIL